MRNAGKMMIVVAAALSLAACANSQVASNYPAGDGPTYPAPSPAGVSGTSGAPQTSTQARACTADDIKVSGDFGSKPSVTIPDTCSAPTSLLTKDLKAGTGATVAAGSTVETNYDLFTWSDRVDQQNTFGAQPYPVTVGQGKVIPGWEQGLDGMKQGGRRLLVIPPELGYGATGNGPIKPNETLVFVVDAVQVTG
ncbi:FKBP-type peptidyl-prolyl cis-trans isomerase [Amycolatopsis taiwanensis]|uniref:Peptidyl-prolyl cis-trans isomerase n=1 Tax=Amycolatopsis taiwanensis TaxID=342230 RepID=A0A9W6QZZ6_9PSEU|nr:FKBP-type peptidyl-prolyl cis-trans isomerase [Amycolatopsis taiwanensis]GLY65773.1 peptidyl-prolyl cis-trans isomerase [Amycolatopsis taiwanensis]